MKYVKRIIRQLFDKVQAFKMVTKPIFIVWKYVDLFYEVVLIYEISFMKYLIYISYIYENQHICSGMGFL